MLRLRHPIAVEAMNSSRNRATIPSSMCYRICSALSTLLLALLFGAASLGTLGQDLVFMNRSLAHVRYLVIASSLIALLLINLLTRTNVRIYKISSRSLVILLFWFTFGLMCVISAFSNGSRLGASFWYLIGIPLVFFFMLPRLFGDRVDKAINIALIIGHLPYVIISILKFPVTYPYKGVFHNPNSMGVTCASIACGLFGLLSGTVWRRPSIGQLAFCNILLGSCFVFVLLSGSRTSLAGFLAMLLAFLWGLGTKERLRALATIIVTLLVFVGLGGLLGNQFLRDTVAGIVEKATYKRSIGVPLSGREYIWRQTLDDVALLGHGPSYFGNTFGLGAHNSLIGIVGIYGPVAAILLLGFALAALYASFRVSLIADRECPLRGTPLIVMIGFG